jgi:hypothetical protein
MVLGGHARASVSGRMGKVNGEAIFGTVGSGKRQAPAHEKLVHRVYYVYHVNSVHQTYI